MPSLLIMKQLLIPMAIALKQQAWAIVTGLSLAIALYGLAALALRRYQTRFIFRPSATLDATPAAAQLAYEEIWLPVGEGQVHGWWIPAAAAPASRAQTTPAPAILYLHGNGSNLGDLVNRARRFHQWGYSILLIDYRGYGRSSGPFPNEARVYEDAETAWQYLSQQVAADRIVIYGRSIGGAIAIHLAAQHPDAAGLILESSFTSMAAVVEQSPVGLVFPADRLVTQRFDSLSKIRSLPTPLLLLHGTADAIVPPEMSQALHDAASGPKALVWIDGADHNDVPETGGDRYAEAIQTFVAEWTTAQ